MSVSKLDRDTFESVVRKYGRAVFNIAFRIVNDYDDAMDITQTTFMKIYERKGSYDPTRDMFSWLYTIAVNEAINVVKRKRRSVGIEGHDCLDRHDPEQECAQNEASRHLQLALMTLGIDYRIVLVLRHFQDLSYAEIARILDIPEKTVKSRLFSGRQLLRDSLLKQGYAR